MNFVGYLDVGHSKESRKSEFRAFPISAKPLMEGLMKQLVRSQRLGKKRKMKSCFDNQQHLGIQHAEDTSFGIKLCSNLCCAKC